MYLKYQISRETSLSTEHKELSWRTVVHAGYWFCVTPVAQHILGFLKQIVNILNSVGFYCSIK